MEQIQDAETTPDILSYLIFNKGANTFTGRKITSLVNGAGKTGSTHAED